MSLGPMELGLIFLIGLLIVGPSKIGDLGGAVGGALRDFRKAISEPEDETKAAEPQVAATSVKEAAVEEKTES